MPGSPVKIGPFVGGLNNTSQAGESKDNEVVELINFELALDTSLVSRPPIEVVPGTPSNLANQWDVLGIYRITASNWFVIVNQPTGATTYNVNAYALGDFSAAPTLIKTTTGVNNRIVSFAQYNDWCYFNVTTGATDTGFRWKSGSAVSAIATMPRGNVMISWKDRLWVTASNQATDGNYLWFSTVDATGPHPETWNVAVDFINIDPGFGGLNTTLLPLISSLLVFKEDATYRFSFPSAPKNGEVTKVSGQIGAATAKSAVGFESYAYVYDQGRIYELINNKFTQINLNVQFNSATDAPDATAPGVDLSVVNRRLLVRYYNTLYSYHVDTRTWSQWKTNGGTPGAFLELPADSASALPSTFIAASRGTTQLPGTNRIYDAEFIKPETNNKRLVFPNTTATASITSNTVTLTKTGAGFPEFFLSEEGVLSNYDIPVSPKQAFTLTATVSSNMAGVSKMEIHYNFLLRSGSVSSITQAILATEVPNLIDQILVPDDALLMNVSLKVSAASPVGTIITMTNPVLIRSTANSPVSVLRLVDKYQNTTAMEYVECYMKTKAFDYQANSVFKRLFLWGLDVKTTRPIEMSAIPLGRKQSVTWDDLEPYTWDQLEAGIWDNPLSWLGVSNTVIDMTDEISDVSENGRFFVKAAKSLRFRQIQYAVKMTTLGNSETGPCKLFSLTTYTKASQMVVDKAT
jgi:hypothetical protein